MLIHTKEIPFYYLNFEGYVDRKKNMESLINSLGINGTRVSSAYKSDLRQNRISLGVLKMLLTAIENNKYPFGTMDDDMALITDLPAAFSIPEESNVIMLGGSLYETGGVKPKMFIEDYNAEYYRVYYMLSMHSMIISDAPTAYFLVESVCSSLTNNQFLDVDLALKSKNKLYLTPKNGPFFYQQNYNEPVTRFLWSDVKNKITNNL
jgi:hypothetical protein